MSLSRGLAKFGIDVKVGDGELRSHQSTIKLLRFFSVELLQLLHGIFLDGVDHAKHTRLTGVSTRPMSQTTTEKCKKLTTGRGLVQTC